jgi:hypothetical protein
MSSLLLERVNEVGAIAVSPCCTACFRDITAGSNGAYSAGSGYDMVTGIGVPNVAELIKAFTSSSA